MIAEISLDKQRCIGSKCSLCAYVCPTNVFTIKLKRVKVASPQYCKLCYECMEVCPYTALHIKQIKMNF